jgi:hypothetical protein
MSKKSLQQYLFLQNVIGIQHTFSMFELLSDEIFRIKNTKSKEVCAHNFFLSTLLRIHLAKYKVSSI